jgi:hypothetical protein
VKSILRLRRNHAPFAGPKTTFASPKNKAFVHKLNNHQGDFNIIKTFRQLLFDRLLSEFHGSKTNKIKLDKFCEKWEKFEFFEIKNNSIVIHFNF